MVGDGDAVRWGLVLTERYRGHRVWVDAFWARLEADRAGLEPGRGLDVANLEGPAAVGARETAYAGDGDVVAPPLQWSTARAAGGATIDPVPFHLRPPSDPPDAAAILFNAAGWGYVQLRHFQRWPADWACGGVLGFVMRGLAGSLTRRRRAGVGGSSGHRMTLRAAGGPGAFWRALASTAECHPPTFRRPPGPERYIRRRPEA